MMALSKGAREKKALILLILTDLSCDTSRFCGFSTTEDLEKILAAKKNGALRALVLGLSIDGIKAALALKDAGFLVTMIDEKKSLPFSLHFSKEILSRFIEEISLVSGKTIEILEDEKIKLVYSHGSLETDLVVVPKKAKPDLSLLMDAGALVDVAGVQVDDHLMSTLPNIYACGSTVPMPTMAAKCFNGLKTAHVAAFNASSVIERETKTLSSQTQSVLVGKKLFARTGMTELEAFNYFSRENVIATTVYQQDLCIRVMVDKTSERIIGAEVFGEQGVKRRIDLLTFAISQKFSPKALLDLDMVDEEGELDPLKEAATRAHLALVDNIKVISADHLALWLASNQGFSVVNVGQKPLSKKTIHLPLEKIRERILEMESLEPIVLYSESGHESFLAQQALGQRGLNTYHLDGGLLAWQMLCDE